MRIFGLTITRQPESEEMKELRILLREEKKLREKVARDKQKADRELKEATEKAEKEEAKRLLKQQKTKKAEAITHLEVAERYNEALLQAEGARAAKLTALIETRLEKAANLGFPLKGTITGTIAHYGN